MNFHAHELLEKIAMSEEHKSLAEWKEIAQAQFGADAKFENCGGMQFDIHQVFDFFQMKKKVKLTENGILEPNFGNICSGPGHNH